MELAERKYTIEELVTIGDDIHHSVASFIVAKNVENDKQKITFAVLGSREAIIDMLYNIFVKNPTYEDIMIDAITLSQEERLKEFIFNKNDK